MDEWRRTGAGCLQALAVVGMIAVVPFIVMFAVVACGSVADVVRPILAGEAPEARRLAVAVMAPLWAVGMGWAWLRVGRALLWQIGDMLQGRDTGPADWWVAAHHPLTASRSEIAARVAAGKGWPHRRAQPAPFLDLSRRPIRLLAWISLAGWVGGCAAAWLLRGAWEATQSWWAGAGAGAVACVACLCLLIPWAWTGGRWWQRASMWIGWAALWPWLVIHLLCSALSE